MAADREPCLAAGMDAFLGTSLTVKGLEAMLARCVAAVDDPAPAPDQSQASVAPV